MDGLLALSSPPPPPPLPARACIRQTVCIVLFAKHTQTIKTKHTPLGCGPAGPSRHDAPATPRAWCIAFATTAPTSKHNGGQRRRARACGYASPAYASTCPWNRCAAGYSLTTCRETAAKQTGKWVGQTRGYVSQSREASILTQYSKKALLNSCPSALQADCI